MPLDFPSGATVGTIYTGTNGAVYAYDGTKWRISSQTTSTYQDIIPAANLTYDLGSTSSQWRSLYVGTSTIYLGGTALSVSNGQLTVGGNPVSGGGVTTSTLVNGTATVRLIVGGGNNPYTLFPEYDGGQLYIQGAELATTNSGTVVISAGPNGGNIYLNTYGASPKQWAFNNGGILNFPDGSTSTGASISVPYATSNSYKIRVQGPLGAPYFGAIGTTEITSNMLILPSVNGLIQSGQGGGTWALDSNNKSLTFPNNSLIAYGDGLVYSTGSLVTRIIGDLGLYQIHYNNFGLYWTFSTSTLVFPDGTSQTTAFTGQATTSTLVNGTATVQLIVGGGNNPYTLFPEYDGGQLFIQGGELATPNSGTVVISAGPNGGNIYLNTYGASPKQWAFNNGGILNFPDGSTSTGASIYVPYATSSSYKISTQLPPIGPPPYGATTFEVTAGKIILPTGNGYIQSGNYTDPWSLDSANKGLYFPNNSRINYFESGGALSTGSMQVDVRSGGIFQIRLNDSGKTWAFDNSGNIVFPDGTTQTTAYVSGSVGGYSPSNVGNWLGTPTVATYTEALDELASRTTTLESIAGVTGTNVTNVFMYNSNASFSMTQNVEYKIPFDTAATGNDSGDFQTTSSQFIPQIAGWYLIETHLNFGGVWSGNVNISVYKNNNQERLIGSSWIGNGGGVGGGTLVYSNGTTDIFEIRATQQSGGVQALEHGAAKTWFQATWMKS